ncbi:hypothetical protein [Oceanicola sp. 502str15]|uniref:hypothetical protein n=1 Tax=Oceanicola sp. 502str15 TaxID=2696061 RepID=UPI0020952613|nr:hypothetical protein [Oceanicola sp. 502str15]MCO6385356.1 hypothetical protein [Oceanicola sp. 502str15]
MNIAEIMAAVEAGKCVHWANEAYRVHRDSTGQFLIIFAQNGSTIGLTDRSGRRLNGAEADFYVSKSRQGAATGQGRAVRASTLDTPSGDGPG